MADEWTPTAQGFRAEPRDGVAVLWLDRPEVLNALTLEMLTDLAAALRWYGREGRSLGIVLTGAGRAFSSGDDLKITGGLDRASFERLIDAFQDVTRAIVQTEVPVVAAVNGIAVGGAAEIACACDIRVGCPSSEFLFPENGLGLTISNASSLTLPWLVGPRALGVVLLGERMGADRALQLGLLDVVVEDGEVVTEARRITAEVGEAGRATPLHLRLLRLPVDDVERALDREREAALEAWDRGWPQEGIRRFSSRRRGSSG